MKTGSSWWAVFDIWKLDFNMIQKISVVILKISIFRTYFDEGVSIGFCQFASFPVCSAFEPIFQNCRYPITNYQKLLGNWLQFIFRPPPQYQDTQTGAQNFL